MGSSSQTKYFMMSGIPSKQRSDLASKIYELKGKYIDNKYFSRACTHLVCGDIIRSEKYLSACVTGKYVLVPDYIEESCCAGRWLPETGYEWSKFWAERYKIHLKQFISPRKWRVRETGMFHEWRVVMMLQGEARTVYKRLILLGQGKIVSVSTPLDAAKVNGASITHIFVDNVNRHHVTALLGDKVPCLKPEYIAEFIIKGVSGKTDKFSIPSPVYDHLSTSLPDNMHVDIITELSTPASLEKQQPSVRSSIKRKLDLDLTALSDLTNSHSQSKVIKKTYSHKYRTRAQTRSSNVYYKEKILKKYFTPSKSKLRTPSKRRRTSCMCCQSKKKNSSKTGIPLVNGDPDSVNRQLVTSNKVRQAKDQGNSDIGNSPGETNTWLKQSFKPELSTPKKKVRTHLTFSPQSNTLLRYMKPKRDNMHGSFKVDESFGKNWPEYYLQHQPYHHHHLSRRAICCSSTENFTEIILDCSDDCDDAINAVRTSLPHASVAPSLMRTLIRHIQKTTSMKSAEESYHLLCDIVDCQPPCCNIRQDDYYSVMCDSQEAWDFLHDTIRSCRILPDTDAFASHRSLLVLRYVSKLLITDYQLYIQRSREGDLDPVQHTLMGRTLWQHIHCATPTAHCTSLINLIPFFTTLNSHNLQVLMCIMQLLSMVADSVRMTDKSWTLSSIIFGHNIHNMCMKVINVLKCIPSEAVCWVVSTIRPLWFRMKLCQTWVARTNRAADYCDLTVDVPQPFETRGTAAQLKNLDHQLLVDSLPMYWSQLRDVPLAFWLTQLHQCYRELDDINDNRHAISAANTTLDDILSIS